MADTSLEQWARIVQTLSDREIEVFLLVCRYLDATGYSDVTGHELTDWSGMPVTSVRPRLHGLVKKGWLLSGESRESRSPKEQRCHPVWPNVPKAAIDRLRASQEGA